MRGVLLRATSTPITPSTEGVEGLCHARHPQFRSRGTLVATDSPDRTRSDRRDDVEAHRAQHRYRSAICLIIWYCDIGYGDLNPKSLETVVKIGAADNLLYTGSAPPGPTRPCQARPEAPRLRAPWDVHVGVHDPPQIYLSPQSMRPHKQLDQRWQDLHRIAGHAQGSKVVGTPAESASRNSQDEQTRACSISSGRIGIGGHANRRTLGD